MPPRIAVGQAYPITHPLHAGIHAEDWRVRLVLEGGGVLLLETSRKEDALWFTVPKDAMPGLITVELTGSESLSVFAPILGPDAVELVP
ncbi:MAG: hypothetical protein JNK87_28525 [Bryobacterales bacterium]|nr:hypothetical protein [Bryobacterales bacterium]